MSILKTAIDKTASGFRQNHDVMTALCSIVHEKMANLQNKDIEKAVRIQEKMTARERIELLLDIDSPFLELMPLVACEDKDNNTSDTLIGGIGTVSGKMCLIIARSGTAQSHFINDIRRLKSARLDTIAAENGLPAIHLIEKLESKVAIKKLVPMFDISNNKDDLKDTAQQNSTGIPTISVVFDSSDSTDLELKASDYNIFIKNKNTDVLADYVAADEQDGIRIAREIMETLPNYHTSTPSEAIKQPLYAADDLLGIVDTSIKTLFEMREVMARIIDGSDFVEFKPNRGETIITGFANIHGYAIGIVANNGVLGSEAVEKVTEFVHVCEQQNRPLVFLQYITEGIVAQKYSEKEMMRYHAKMIKAIKRSETPVITLILAENYDTEHYAMYGRNCEPRFIFAYPNNKNYTTSNIENDGVIDPRETRNYVGFALAMVSG